MLIRPAEPRDAPVIHEGATCALDPGTTEADALAYRTGPDKETFVGEEDGAVLGTRRKRPDQAGGGRRVRNRGRKTGHRMWFAFPQVVGLGASGQSRRYAIRSLAEARAYLAHPLLGARYRECVAALRDLAPTSAEAAFGTVDAAKLRSSLPLFAEAAPGALLLAAALKRWCGGEKDGRTVAILHRHRTTEIDVDGS